MLIHVDMLLILIGVRMSFQARGVVTASFS